MQFIFEQIRQGLSQFGAFVVGDVRSQQARLVGASDGRRQAIGLGLEDGERRHVSTDGRPGSDQRVAADGDEVVGAAVGADDGAGFKPDVPGQRRSFSQDGAVVDVTVMGDVAVVAQDVLVADSRQVSAHLRADVRRNAASEPVSMPDHQQRVPAGVFEILRHGAEDTPVADGVAGADGGVADNRDALAERCSRADRHAGPDHASVAQQGVLGDLRRRIDLSDHASLRHGVLLLR